VQWPIHRSSFVEFKSIAVAWPGFGQTGVVLGRLVSEGE